MPSLKRRIAEARIKLRRRNEASLKAEQRRIQLRENKAHREAQRHSKYGKAESAREERSAKQKETLRKTGQSLWSGLKTLGKAVDKHMSGKPKRKKPTARKPSTRTAKKTASRKRR